MSSILSPQRNSHNRQNIQGRPWRVLIVDDDQVIGQTLKSYLDFQEDCEVYRAENALEALSVLERIENIDIVFVDINMPGMNGIEFVRRLKNKDSTIVAAVITGQPSMDVIVQAMRSGASDFLSEKFVFKKHGALFYHSLQTMITIIL